MRIRSDILTGGRPLRAARTHLDSRPHRVSSQPLESKS